MLTRLVPGTWPNRSIIRGSTPWVAVTLVAVLALSCAPAGVEEQAGTGPVSSYEELVDLFLEFREFQSPDLVGDVPDYTPPAIEARRQGLVDLRQRFDALNVSSWPVSEKIDYLVVRAEMNGLDFYLRVLRPWSRDPGFYLQSQRGAGPTRVATLRRPREWPMTDDRLESFRNRLQAVPAVYEQAKANLQDVPGDLARLAIHYLHEEISIYTELIPLLAEHHPDLVADAERGAATVREYGEWLEANLDSMTAQAGIGVDNYTWMLQNVLLVPYTWQDMLNIVEREDDRVWAFLKLEENRNRDLPPLQPVRERYEHWERQKDALDTVVQFILDDEIFTVPDYLNSLAYLGPAPEPGPLPEIRDYFENTADREPMPEQTHEFIGHWLDHERYDRDERPIRGGERLYAIGMIRSEGWAFGLEELMMHAGYLDGRPQRGREIVYLQTAFRSCRARADLLMHSNDFTLMDAIDYCVACAPKGWLPKDGLHVWYEMETNLRWPGWHTGMVVGKQEFMKLMGDRASQLREDFILRDFMDEFLAAGNIPFSLIRWEMTGNEDEIETLW